MCVSQDGATGSRNGEEEEGDGGPPLREQNPSSQGDGTNDRLSTNNNSVGIMTDHSSECGEPHYPEAPCTYFVKCSSVVVL